jgi:CHAT domain-containing protein
MSVHDRRYRVSGAHMVLILKRLSVAALNLSGFFVLVFLTACSTMGVQEQSMLAKSDYGNLIRHVRANYTYDTMDVGTLDALCQAYFETRNYKSFVECSEVLVKKAPREGIRRTTTNRRKMGAMVGGLFGGIADSYMTEPFSYEDVVAPMLSKRAMIHLDFEDYQAATETSNQAIEYLTRVGTQYPDFLVEAYGISGLAYALRGDRKNAEARIASMRATNIENEDSDLLRQTALIKIYIALKDYEQARNVTTANTSSSFLKFVNTIDYGWRMTTRELKNIEIPNKFMMAKIFYETGDWKTAEKYYNELLNDPQFQNLGAASVVALHDRGMIAGKSGNMKEAKEFFQRAIEIIEFQRSTISTEASKIGFVGDKQDVYHQLVRILCNEEKYEEAFEYVERSKSRALVDLLATKKNFAAREGNADELRTVLAQQNEAEVQALNPDISVDGRQTRSVQIKTREYLKTRAPELASLMTVTSQSVPELKALIPSDDVLVEYYYRDKDMYAFVVSQKGLTAIKLNSEGLLEDVQEYRKLIETTKTGQQTAIAKKLYLRLFQPIEGYLHTKNLIIIPHGALHYLPLNALYNGTEYLIDRYSIRIMPSAGAIRYLQNKHSGENGGILAFGNPDLGNPNHDLAFAQDEAREVAKTRGNSRVFLRKDATETALRKYGNSYTYIHFATHGVFDSEAPLKSALFLAPDTQYDGILTVDKLYSLQLNANLITMSACETGLAQIANGDDLIGLARGFLYAGASAIVSSLWKVDDLSTSYLMTRFYSAMEKTNMRDALRAAQLETRKKYPHPYHWAAFQLTGSAN